MGSLGTHISPLSSPSSSSSSSISSFTTKWQSLSLSSFESEYEKKRQKKKKFKTLVGTLCLLRENIYENRRPRKKRYIHCEREEAYERVLQDYFVRYPEFTDAQFRRRFRMNRHLFHRILDVVTSYNEYFVHKPNCTLRIELYPILKVAAAMRMLTYGCAADQNDEYLCVSETTSIQSLLHLCDVVIGVFEETYMRTPNKEDIARMLKMSEERGFPEMLSSIDCMHWRWKNCLTGWNGSHTNGFIGYLSVILEVVASQNLWIWHTFFGMAGSNNDKSVLDTSHLFDELISGEAPKCEYLVNGNKYTMGYYLANGIYLCWATLIQTISQPIGLMEVHFAKEQEAARKDVERAFRVLKARFGIIAGSTRFWKKKYLSHIVKTCIILHNMIVEDERLEILRWRRHSDEDREDLQVENDEEIIRNAHINKLMEIQDQSVHNNRKKDLIEHLWLQTGKKGKVTIS